MQARVLLHLSGRRGAVLPAGEIFDRLYASRPDCDQPESDVAGVRVLISKMRPKLASLGLAVEARWGAGYELVEKK